MERIWKWASEKRDSLCFSSFLSGLLKQKKNIAFFFTSYVEMICPFANPLFPEYILLSWTVLQCAVCSMFSECVGLLHLPLLHFYFLFIFIRLAVRFDFGLLCTCVCNLHIYTTLHCTLTKKKEGDPGVLSIAGSSKS